MGYETHIKKLEYYSNSVTWYYSEDENLRVVLDVPERLLKQKGYGTVELEDLIVSKNLDTYLKVFDDVFTYDMTVFSDVEDAIVRLLKELEGLKNECLNDGDYAVAHLLVSKLNEGKLTDKKIVNFLENCTNNKYLTGEYYKDLRIPKEMTTNLLGVAVEYMVDNNAPDDLEYFQIKNLPSDYGIQVAIIPFKQEILMFDDIVIDFSSKQKPNVALKDMNLVFVQSLEVLEDFLEDVENTLPEIITYCDTTWKEYLTLKELNGYNEMSTSEKYAFRQENEDSVEKVYTAFDELATLCSRILFYKDNLSLESVKPVVKWKKEHKKVLKELKRIEKFLINKLCVTIS